MGGVASIVSTIFWRGVYIGAATSLVFGLAAALHTKATVYKIKLYIEAIAYLALCTDKSGFPAPGTSAQEFAQLLQLKEQGQAVEEKVTDVIFLRHGESMWNETFNRSLNPIFFIPRLIIAFATEGYILLTGLRDSWFYDSPLNAEGIQQAQEHRKFLSQGTSEKDTDRLRELVSAMKGDIPNTVLVSSPLRRALSTTLVTLWDRLERDAHETVLVHPALQEISRNPDTLCITPPSTLPEASWVDKKETSFLAGGYKSKFIVDMHTGNKPIKAKGYDRIEEFADWIFKEDRNYVIIGGHSLWFRFFFRAFLPRNVEHISKNNKVANGGSVGFTIRQLKCGDRVGYQIDVDSITPIYLGFS